MSANNSPWIKWFRRFCWLLVLSGASVLILYVFRSPLLTGLANAWIVKEPLSKSDVIVVLGGGVENRPFEAARLYHQGLAPRILVMDPKPGPATDLGLALSDTELTRQILSKQGVPSSALVILGNGVKSTYEESVALRDWSKTNAIKSVIIATDIFHTRRARWLFRKELKNTGIRVTVDAVPARDYTASNWWRDERGVVAFQNEVLKSAYYWAKY